jgi:Raf kinase inhibitor-like YbhB/YbcL family protein
MRPALVAVALAGALLTGCGDAGDDGGVRAAAVEPDLPASITVTSAAFDEGEPIPEKYTCHGDGISPPLAWSVIDNAGSLALVVDDPDAKGAGYVHWVVLGLPTGHGGIDEGALPAEAREVPASGGLRWRPPCPPSGTHHYRFTLYAYSMESPLVALSEDTPLQELLEALADGAVAWGRLTGTVTASGGDTGGGY